MLPGQGYVVLRDMKVVPLKSTNLSASILYLPVSELSVLRDRKIRHFLILQDVISSPYLPAPTRNQPYLVVMVKRRQPDVAPRICWPHSVGHQLVHLHWGFLSFWFISKLSHFMSLYMKTSEMPQTSPISDNESVSTDMCSELQSDLLVHHSLRALPWIQTVASVLWALHPNSKTWLWRPSISWTSPL